MAVLKTNIFNAICADQTGATAVEYGLLLSLIFLVILAGIGGMADALGAKYNAIDKEITAAAFSN